MKVLTTEQIRGKAHKLAADLHIFHSLHVQAQGGNLGAHDMALITALVNAETHLAAHYYVPAVPAKKPAKKAKRG